MKYAFKICLLSTYLYLNPSRKYWETGFVMINQKMSFCDFSRINDD